MKITRLHDGVIKVESGDWILTQSCGNGFAVHKNTAEHFNFERGQIDDLVAGLNEIRREMILEQHHAAKKQ